MMQLMDIADAMVESQHNKIKATLDDGTNMVLEKIHMQGVGMGVLWSLHIALANESYTSWDFFGFHPVIDRLGHYDVDLSSKIWLPIEIANEAKP